MNNIKIFACKSAEKFTKEICDCLEIEPGKINSIKFKRRPAMKNEFCKALISQTKNPALPEEMDWFGILIGEWDILWKDNIGTKNEKTQKGEWIFSRVLNGFGIQDLFIVPSREERIRLNMPNAEYGNTIRMYNPAANTWEIYYTCIGEYTRLSAEKVHDKIVLTEVSQKKMRWIFSEITEKSFHWQNRIQKDNNEWIVQCDCIAKKRF